MISFLLRTTGQALIGGGVRYAIGNEKIRGKFVTILQKLKPRKRKTKITTAQLHEKIRDMEGWITTADQKFDEMEHYNEDHFVAMRKPISPDIFDPKTGEVLEDPDGLLEPTHWNNQKARRA